MFDFRGMRLDWFRLQVKTQFMCLDIKSSFYTAKSEEYRSLLKPYLALEILQLVQNVTKAFSMSTSHSVFLCFPSL